MIHLCHCRNNSVRLDELCRSCDGVIVHNPFPDKFELTTICFLPEQIKTRVKELAFAIDIKYSDKDDLVLLGALTGAFVFLSDLSRELRTPHKVKFIEASSYHGGTETSGKVKIGGSINNLNLGGKHVLIVEDILDTGLTYKALKDTLKQLDDSPQSIDFCAILSKPDKLAVTELEINDDFIGFKLRPPKFVIGYGLDYLGYFRGLPFIVEAREKN